MEKFNIDAALIHAAIEIYGNEATLSINARLEEALTQARKYSCYITVTSVVCSGLFGTSDPFKLSPEQKEMFILDADRVIQRARLRHVLNSCKGL